MLTGEFETINSLPEARLRMAYHYTPGKSFAYVIGGEFKTDKPMRICLRQDLKNQKFTFMANLKLPRSNPGVIEYKNYLMVFGGKSDRLTS